MAIDFNIIAKLQLEGPGNAMQVSSNINKALRGVNTSINIDTSRARSGVGQLNSGLEAARTTMGRVRSQTNDMNAALRATVQVSAQAGDFFSNLAAQAGLAARRFLAFTVAAGSFVSLVRGFKDGIRAAIDFDLQMNKLAQVAGGTSDQIAAIRSEVSRLATTLGVSSAGLANVAVTLKQAGLSARDTKTALEAIALTDLAPNFEGMKQTTEGMIASWRQFNIEAKDWKNTLGSMNAVAGQFAVEASDLVTAIQKAGGAFAAVAGDAKTGQQALAEFMGLFTSVRSTTRESADTIATGLRTIFTRMQRADTVSALKELGVNLRYTAEEAKQLGQTNLTNQFVGAYEAVRRLSTGLAGLRETDPRFAQVIEQLGGFRQISKVIPLLKQFETAQQAVNTAIAGQISLQTDAEKRQESLANKIGVVKEQYLSLFQKLTNSKGFESLADALLKVATGLAKVMEYAAPLLPILTAMAAIKVGTVAGSVVRNFGANFFNTVGAPTVHRAGGGTVPGSGDSDSVPALLTPGEFVINKRSAARIGLSNLRRLNSVNRYAKGGLVQRFQDGDKVGEVHRFEYMDYKDTPIGRDARVEAQRLGIAIGNSTQIFVELAKSGKVFRGLVSEAQKAAASLSSGHADWKGRSDTELGELLSKMTPSQSLMFRNNIPNISRALRKRNDITGELHDAGTLTLARAVLSHQGDAEDFKPYKLINQSVNLKARDLAERGNTNAKAFVSDATGGENDTRRRTRDFEAGKTVSLNQYADEHTARHAANPSDLAAQAELRAKEEAVLTQAKEFFGGKLPTNRKEMQSALKEKGLPASGSNQALADRVADYIKRQVKTDRGADTAMGNVAPADAGSMLATLQQAIPQSIRSILTAHGSTVSVVPGDSLLAHPLLSNTQNKTMMAASPGVSKGGSSFITSEGLYESLKNFFSGERSTLLHERGHDVDFTLGKAFQQAGLSTKSRLSDSADFRKIHDLIVGVMAQSGRYTPESYDRVKDNRKESFAEGFNHYVTGDLARENLPKEVTEYFEKLFRTIEENQNVLKSKGVQSQAIPLLAHRPEVSSQAASGQSGPPPSRFPLPMAGPVPAGAIVPVAGGPAVHSPRDWTWNGPTPGYRGWNAEQTANHKNERREREANFARNNPLEALYQTVAELNARLSRQHPAGAGARARYAGDSTTAARVMTAQEEAVGGKAGDSAAFNADISTRKSGTYRSKDNLTPLQQERLAKLRQQKEEEAAYQNKLAEMSVRAGTTSEAAPLPQMKAKAIDSAIKHSLEQVKQGKLSSEEASASMRDYLSPAQLAVFNRRLEHASGQISEKLTMQDENGNQVGLIHRRAQKQADEEIASRGGADALSDVTKARLEQKAVIEQTTKIERELLSAQKNVLALTDKKKSATERNIQAQEDVRRAMEGNAKVVRDLNGKILGLEETVQKAKAQGLTPTGAGGLGYAVGDFSSRVGGFFGRANERLRQSRLGRMFSGSAAMGTSIALSLAADNIERMSGDAQSAAASGHTTRYRSGKAVAGALQGAATYGIVGGMVAGPYGAVAAAVGGALYSFVSSLKESEKEIRQVKINNALTEFSDKLNTITSVGLDATADNVKQAASARLASEQQLSTEANRKEATSFFTGFHVEQFNDLQQRSLRQNYASMMPSMAHALQQEAERIGRANVGGKIEDLEHQLASGGKGLNSQLLNIIAGLRGISTADVLKELRQNILSGQKEQQAVASRRGEEGNINSFGRLLLAVQAASDSLLILNQRSKTLGELFEGVIGASRVSSRSENLNQMGRLDRGAMMPLNTIAAIGGNIGVHMRDVGARVDEAHRLLPDILADAVRSSKNNVTGDDIVTNVTHQLSEKMGPRSEDIIASVRRQMNEVTKKGPGKLFDAVQIDTSKFTEELLRPLSGPIKEFGSKIAKELDDQINRFIGSLTNFYNRLQRIGQNYDKLANMQTASYRQRLEFAANQTGRVDSNIVANAPLQSLEHGFNFQQTRLAQVNGPGAFDPNVLRRRFGDISNELMKAEQNQQEVYERTGGKGQEFAEAAEKVLQLKSSAVNLMQAMQHLTDTTTRNAAAQEKLNRLNQEQSSRLNFGEKYLTSSMEGKMEINRGILLANRAANQGNLNNFTPEQINSIRNALKDLGGIKLAGFKGQPHADDLWKNLVANTGNGVFQLPKEQQDEKKQLENVIGERMKVAEDAILAFTEAQKTLAENDRQIADARQAQFFRELDKKFNFLQKIFIGNEMARVGDERRRVGELSDKSEILNSLGIKNVDQLKGIKKSGDVENYFNAQDTIAAEQAKYQDLIGSGKLSNLFGQNGGLGGSRSFHIGQANKQVDDILRSNTQLTGDQISRIVANFNQRVGKRFEGKNLQNDEESGNIIFNHLRKAAAEELVGGNQGTILGNANLARGQAGQRLYNQSVNLNRLDELGRDGAGRAKLKEQMDAFDGTSKAIGGLRDRTEKLDDEFRRLQEEMRRLNMAGAKADKTPVAPAFASGGNVANHPGAPQGSDTVPAWLTPGEFVVRRDSARANRGLLEKINRSQGALLLADGGGVDWQPLKNWFNALVGGPQQRQPAPIGPIQPAPAAPQQFVDPRQQRLNDILKRRKEYFAEQARRQTVRDQQIIDSYENADPKKPAIIRIGRGGGDIDAANDNAKRIAFQIYNAAKKRQAIRIRRALADVQKGKGLNPDAASVPGRFQAAPPPFAVEGGAMGQHDNNGIMGAGAPPVAVNNQPDWRQAVEEQMKRRQEAIRAKERRQFAADQKFIEDAENRDPKKPFITRIGKGGQDLELANDNARRNHELAVAAAKRRVQNAVRRENLFRQAGGLDALEKQQRQQALNAMGNAQQIQPQMQVQQPDFNRGQAIANWRMAGQINNFNQRVNIMRGPSMPGDSGQRNVAANVAWHGQQLQDRYIRQNMDYQEWARRRLPGVGINLPNVALGFASGGMVGGSGTGDSVPSLLTPGEFVLNRGAVSRLGANNLAHFNRGGLVGHYESGGQVSGSGSGGSSEGATAMNQLSDALKKFVQQTGGFEQATQSLAQTFTAFGGNATALAKAIDNMPRSLTLQGTHTVNVTINGAEVLSKLTPEIQSLVTDQVKSSLARIFHEQMPDANVTV